MGGGGLAVGLVRCALLLIKSRKRPIRELRGLQQLKVITLVLINSCADRFYTEFLFILWSIKKWPQTRGGVFWFICATAGRKMLNCYYNDLKTSEWAVHVLLTALIVSLSGLCGRNISNRTRRWCHNSGWSWGSWECWNQENGDAGYSNECDVIVQRRDNCQKRLRPLRRFNTG